MASRFSDLVEEVLLSARAFKDFGEHVFNPTIRLGVTGLSRAGKTVFITALIHGLTRGGRFPVFEPFASGPAAQVNRPPPTRSASSCGVVNGASANAVTIPGAPWQCWHNAYR